MGVACPGVGWVEGIGPSIVPSVQSTVLHGVTSALVVISCCCCPLHMVLVIAGTGIH